MSRAPIQVTITPDLRRFTAGMRALSRTANQIQRNAATRPVSAERLEIQRIGQREMKAAIAWFHEKHGTP